MKITIGDTELGFKYTYLLLITLLFFTDGMFLELIYGPPSEDGGEPAAGPEKYIIMLFFFISILQINKLSSFLRNFLIIYYLYFLALVLDSYYRSGSFFQYPHVFAKVIVLFAAFAIGPYYSNIKPKQLIHVIYVITIAFGLDLILYQYHVLSFSAFVDVDRGFHAASTYLILLPCIYFINKYLFDKNFYYLLLFFILFGIIIFLQHRTVWLSMLFAFFINFLLLRKSSATIPLSTISPIFVIPIIAMFLLFSFVLSTNPEIIETFADRIADITNADKQGTGSWRLQQFQSYLPYIQDYPILGMRMQGFELPIQFYNEEAGGIAIFNDGTGHHFHSFYVDRLFYFGLLGTVIMVVPFIYILILAIRKPLLSMEEIVMTSFTLSGIVYGISYNLPVFFFGIMGIALGILHNKYTIQENQELNYAIHNNTSL